MNLQIGPVYMHIYLQQMPESRDAHTLTGDQVVI